MISNTTHVSKGTLAEKIEQLLNGTNCSQKEFVTGYTYAAVYNIAGRMKRSFLALNSKKAVVGVCTEDKVLVAAAVLAALATGIRLALPYACSEQILSDLKQSANVTYAVVDTFQNLPDGMLPITLDASSEEGNLMPEHPIDVNRELLMLYTGGSTGKNKVWSKTICNIFSEAFFLAEKYAVSQNDRIVATVPPYHIYGLLYSILAPFVASAQVAAGMYSYPHEINAAIQDHSASILVSVPMHYKILNGQPLKRTSLRLAFSSAGRLDDADGDAFFRQTGIGVVEVFGSTETGGMAYRCRSVGQKGFTPFENMRAWKIIGDRLYIDSVYISPAAPKNEDGFFITDDRVQPLDDTSFVLLGRTDGIVKVGGKRVDLERVWEKLMRMPNVADAYVYAVPAAGGRENDIIALVSGRVDRRCFRQMLAGRIEPHEIPRQIKFVSAIPITKTGKYNRAAIERLCQAVS